MFFAIFHFHHEQFTLPSPRRKNGTHLFLQQDSFGEPFSRAERRSVTQIAMMSQHALFG